MNELSIPFVLRELANNIEQYNSYGVRIGFSSLSFCGNAYEVRDWDGHVFRFNDLMDAVTKFIAANNSK